MNWISWVVPFWALALVVVGAVELRQQHTELTLPYLRRWPLNVTLGLITAGCSTFAFRIGAIALADQLGGSLSFLPFILIQDFVMWLSHYLLHNVGGFWIWHAIHHSDPDMDATTAFRFHPVEGLWDNAMLLGLVYLLRPSVEAAVASQFFFITCNYFVHANIKMPPRLEAALALVLMTPGLHRSHHSTEMASQKSNYGVTLTIWDRLFKTLHRNPAPQFLGIENVRPDITLKPVFLLAKLPVDEWKKL